VVVVPGTVVVAVESLIKVVVLVGVIVAVVRTVELGYSVVVIVIVEIETFVVFPTAFVV